MAKKLTAMDNFLLDLQTEKLNAKRKIIQAILTMINSSQLRKLKSSLAFDPRKLPLEFDDALSPNFSSPEKMTTLESKYDLVLTHFRPLATQEQFNNLSGWLAWSEQNAISCSDGESTSHKFLCSALHQYLQSF